MRYAKDFKCSDCGKQAVAFFPIVDPDIPAYPYCEECVEKRKMNLFRELLKIK